MRCSYCHNNRGGSYRDWIPGFSFNLCFECSRKLGFFPNCLETQKKCSTCGLFFTPKGTWQISCTDCWLKNHPERKKNFIPKKNVQEVINGEKPVY